MYNYLQEFDPRITHQQTLGWQEPISAHIYPLIKEDNWLISLWSCTTNRNVSPIGIIPFYPKNDIRFQSENWIVHFVEDFQPQHKAVFDLKNIKIILVFLTRLSALEAFI
jgi:hypothetical protein